MPAQCRDQTSVQLIDGHVDQYFRRCRSFPAPFDLLR
jgi:hypothetical protein